MTEEMSSEDIKALSEALGSAPLSEEKYNVHTFLHKVATSLDTTKTGYLKEEEVGMPKLPIRSLQEMALISNKIMGNDYFKEYFQAESEIVTSTSLSKEGFLVKQGTTQTRQLADITKEKKINKGWFKKKEPKADDNSI